MQEHALVHEMPFAMHEAVSKYGHLLPAVYGAEA
jgi:hypothetical protein